MRKKKLLLNDKWTITHPERDIELVADIPCSIFEVLVNHGLIEDPFYGLNEKRVSWVYNSDWHFTKEFHVDSEVFEKEHITLRFKGIDTISKIYLNDTKLGNTNNMFLSYEYSVKSLLRKGKNILKVILKSPAKYAFDQIEKYNKKLTNRMGLPGVAYLRKAQYSFGWDWGPQLPDIAIWQPVELIAWEGVRIKSIYPTQELIYSDLESRDMEKDLTPKVKQVNLQLDIELEATSKSLSSQNLILYVEIQSQEKQTISKQINLAEKNPKVDLVIPKPHLWWTHDLGDSYLYELTVYILETDKEDFKKVDTDGGKIIDKRTQKLGIREIELIREKDEWGESFYFQLNKVPIFAKGANWIPVDSFIPRGKKLGLYQMNLNYAQEANMNMLRVWGGGLYEDDLFYDLCDHLGILVWQDFPFACCIYPYYEEFMELVKKEAIENIKRLRHHASLALWCGNNEVEQLFIAYIGLNRIFNPFKIYKYRKGYKKLFENLLPQLVDQYDPHHAYWPSSPSNGGTDQKSGLFHSNSPDRGDSHFWKVWHMNAPFSAYREFDSRFMSEYGFESFPELKTLKEFCPPEQFDFYSPIMENHQKNRAGNKKIMKYMKNRFSIPEEFENQVILSQITQAEAIEYGIEHWRRKRNGAHCMGSLYWQLNDCWPVASWASLDYFGRWKALHYLAKRNDQPLFFNIKEDADSVEFWLVNDLLIAQKGRIVWEIVNSEGRVLLKGKKEVRVPPCKAVLAETVELSGINDGKKKLDNNAIFYTLFVDEEDEKEYHGFRLFSDPKNFALSDPCLSFTLEKANIPDWDYKLAIHSNNLALYVYIASKDLDFIVSDNYFSLKPDETRDIFLRIQNHLSNQEVDLQKLQSCLEIKSLYHLIQA